MNSGIYIERAQIALENHRYDKVYGIIEQGLPDMDDEDRAEGLALCSLASTVQGKYDRALSYAEDSLRIMPNGVSALRARGMVYGCLLFYDKAEADYNKALSLAPYFDIVYYHLARLYLDKREYGKAEYMIREGLSWDADCVLYLTLLAQIQRLRGREDEGSETIDRALKNNPNNEGALHVKGLFSKKRSERIAAFRAGLFVNPTNKGMQRELFKSRMSQPTVLLVCIAVTLANMALACYGSQEFFDDYKGVGSLGLIVAGLMVGHNLYGLIPLVSVNLFFLTGWKEFMESNDYAEAVFLNIFSSYFVVLLLRLYNSILSNYYLVVCEWVDEVSLYVKNNLIVEYLHHLSKRKRARQYLLGAIVCGSGVVMMKYNVNFVVLFLAGFCLVVASTENTVFTQLAIYYVNQIVLTVICWKSLAFLGDSPARLGLTALVCAVTYPIMVHSLYLLSRIEEK